MVWIIVIVVAIVLLVMIYDLLQRRHAILGTSAGRRCSMRWPRAPCGRSRSS
jgi:hypothetical protein